MRRVVLWFCLLVVMAGLVTSVMAAAPGEQLGSQSSVSSDQMKAARERVAIDWPGPTAKQVFWRGMRCIRCVMWTMVLCHILLAVWVWTDVRKRGTKQWVFVVLALLAGFPAAVLYSLVRIGDKKT